MFQKIKNNPTLKMILDTRNLGLYILAIITLSVTWSSIKVIQKNYEIEKQITVLQQQVDVLDQQTKNQKLINEYYKTDAFLDLAARKYFGKALPGEQFISVPQEVAVKYTHPEAAAASTDANSKTKSKIIQNWQDWINFFLHRDQ
jgi:cell division protein FtsB